VEAILAGLFPILKGWLQIWKGRGRCGTIVTIRDNDDDPKE
jgi:hypothetical protein